MPWPYPVNRGAALFCALMLLAGLAGLSMALLQRPGIEHDLQQQRLLRARMELLLESNLHPLVSSIEAGIKAKGNATALLQPDDDRPRRVTSALVSKEAPIEFLCSGNPITAARVAEFPTQTPGLSLLAEYQEVSCGQDSQPIELAWAWEDLALTTPIDQPVPPYWPAPDFRAYPITTIKSAPATITDPAMPLPVDAELNASLAGPDVVTAIPLQIQMRFGIFASGPLKSREKVVRIRYYFSGTLWNPYNRPLRFHSGSALRPLAGIALSGMPEVRIHNLSRGNSSGWIDLDTIQNDGTSEAGISAYLRIPGILHPGEQLQFEEPARKDQPQGLARTLHPGFEVGPADRIRLEWRPDPDGLQVHLVSESDVSSMDASEPWWSWNHISVDWNPAEWNRADDGEHPFFIHDGSLGFREHHCRWSLHIDASSRVRDGRLDPRRPSIDFNASYPCPEIGSRPASEWWAAVLHEHMGVTTLPENPSARALFSWPSSPPDCLLCASDVVAESSYHRIGTADAALLNNQMDAPELLPSINCGWNGVQHDTQGVAGKWLHSFHINQPSHSQWSTTLRISAINSRDGLSFHQFLTPPADGTDAFFQIQSNDFAIACNQLSATSMSRPSASVSEFFTTGRLLKALLQEGSAPPHSPLPLRGFLRNSPAPVAAGPAAVLHLAARCGETTLLARAWLARTDASESGAPPYKVVHVDWPKFFTLP